MFIKSYYLLVLSFLVIACISVNLTIQNIDNEAQPPEMFDKNTYKLIKNATDKKYGFHKNYPVNLGFGRLHQREANREKFLNALRGSNGEKITYTHSGNCCPFPTDKSELGSGMLDVYTIIWEGNSKPLTLYLNVYEKGEVLIPVGFSAEKSK